MIGLRASLSGARAWPPYGPGGGSVFEKVALAVEQTTSVDARLRDHLDDPARRGFGARQVRVLKLALNLEEVFDFERGPEAVLHRGRRR